MPPGVYLHKIRETIEDRFWRKVEKTDTCWIWKAAKDKRGYGRFGILRRLTLAHRLSFELTFGPVPEGKNVCHACDNPSCVRPDHLFAGTQAENLLDMRKKGRTGHSRGEKHTSAKLKEHQVLAIRASTKTQPELADEFGVSKGLIGNIIHRRRWKHI